MVSSQEVRPSDGLVLRQRLQTSQVQTDPAGVREERVHQPSPDGHRQLVAGFPVPGHLLHPEAGRPLGEDRAGKEQLQRDGPVPRGRAGTWRRTTSKSKVQGSGRSTSVSVREALDHGAALHPQEGLQRGGPALRGAEEIQQPGRLLRVVAAPLGLDADLAAQGDGVDGGAGGFADAQPCGQLRGRCVRLRVKVDDGELELSHRASFPAAAAWPAGCATSADAAAGPEGLYGLLRPPILSKKAASCSRACWPPSNPRHTRRSRPTSS